MAERAARAEVVHLSLCSLSPLSHPSHSTAQSSERRAQSSAQPSPGSRRRRSSDSQSSAAWPCTAHHRSLSALLSCCLAAQLLSASLHPSTPPRCTLFPHHLHLIPPLSPSAVFLSTCHCRAVLVLLWPLTAAGERASTTVVVRLSHAHTAHSDDDCSTVPRSSPPSLSTALCGGAEGVAQDPLAPNPISAPFHASSTVVVGNAQPSLSSLGPSRLLLLVFR